MVRRARWISALIKAELEERKRKILSVTCPICHSSIVHSDINDEGVLTFNSAAKSYIAQVSDFEDEEPLSLMQATAKTWHAHYRHNHTNYDDEISTKCEREHGIMGAYGDYDVIRDDLHSKHRAQMHPIIPEELLTLEDIFRRLENEGLFVPAQIQYRELAYYLEKYYQKIFCISPANVRYCNELQIPLFEFIERKRKEQLIKKQKERAKQLIKKEERLAEQEKRADKYSLGWCKNPSINSFVV